MSRRLQIVLPDPAAAQLHELAVASGEPLARLAGQMVRNELAFAASHGKTRALPSAQPIAGEAGGERARWLEPYHGSAAWRAQMWGAIVALHGRYPRALGALKDGWWIDEAHTEVLCALAVWRAEIDARGHDPREELAFHGQLADYAHSLKTEGGGVAKAWSPGAPPAEWNG